MVLVAAPMMRTARQMHQDSSADAITFIRACDLVCALDCTMVMAMSMGAHTMCVVMRMAVRVTHCPVCTATIHTHDNQHRKHASDGEKGRDGTRFLSH